MGGKPLLFAFLDLYLTRFHFRCLAISEPGRLNRDKNFRICDHPHRWMYCRSHNHSTYSNHPKSAFFNGVLVLNRFSLAWIVDHFFSETLDLSYDMFVRAVKDRWRGSGTPPFAELERMIYKVIWVLSKPLPLRYKMWFGIDRNWTHQRTLPEPAPTSTVIHEISSGLACVVRLASEYYLAA